MPWYVLLTKPRSEKKVAERLKNKGIEVCCPVRTELRQWSDRKKKVAVPLLPSMVLVNLNDDDRNSVFDVNGVVRFLFWLGQPAEVSEDEIDALVSIEEKHTILEVDRITKGDVVDLKGLGFNIEKGTVKYVSGNQCWLILHNLGYVVKVQL